MIDLSADAYVWLKALHLISVISWMAGLLYLPRLFVYHTESETGGVQSETFKVMERRLLRAIMNPAMIASIAFGLPLLLDMPASIWEEGWIYIKLACVAGLLVCHMMMGSMRKKFAEDKNTHSQKYFRYFNEAPTVLMIILVIFVVVKPF